MESTKPRKPKVEPGPEHPTDESQVGVSYLSFEELQPVKLDTQEDQESLVAHLLEVASTCHLIEADWKAQYEAVNMMRSLNKFNRDLLVSVIEKLAKFVRSQIDNLRSNLSKNSLLFLKEFSSCKSASPSQSQQADFSNDETLRSFIAQVYPVALLKTIYEKNFIVVEAKASVTNAVQNMHYPEIIEVLIEGCRSKNLVLAEYSVGYLTTLVKNMDSEFFISGQHAVSALVQQLYVEYDGKRMKMKKQAESIFQELKSKLGIEKIQLVIKASFQDQENGQTKAERILKLFEEKVVKKADQSRDFRSFLKSQKQQATSVFDTTSTSSSTNDYVNPDDQMIIQ
eukprot:403374718